MPAVHPVRTRKNVLELILLQLLQRAAHARAQRPLPSRPRAKIVQPRPGAEPPAPHPAHGRGSGCGTMCRHAIARGRRAPRSTPPTSR